MKDFLKKQSYLIASSVLVVGISFGIGYNIGTHKQSTQQPATTADVTNQETGKPSGVDFSPFWVAWNEINTDFVPHGTSTVPDTNEKVWGAIEGMTASLKDPYTVFFPPEEAKMFQNEVNGSFEGVGMEVGSKDGFLTVIAPLKDTPAYKAGILSGDKILKIDNTLTGILKVDEAIKKIRGKKGTAVHFTVLHPGAQDPVEITVIRDTIAIPTINTEIKHSSVGTTTASDTGLQENGVFIIRLYSFTATSPDLFRDALRKFIESGSNKLILDLRGNPGGYLEAAVDIASWFLPPGKTVVTEDFGKKEPPQVFKSTRYNVFGDNLKFVILVNGGSASASEILSGALKEYGVAKLVGTKTFGKGSVQKLVEIPVTGKDGIESASLKITIARWLTPHGNSISDKGITPDYEVQMSADDIAKGRDPQLDKAVKLLIAQ